MAALGMDRLIGILRLITTHMHEYLNNTPIISSESHENANNQGGFRALGQQGHCNRLIFAPFSGRMTRRHGISAGDRGQEIRPIDPASHFF